MLLPQLQTERVAPAGCCLQSSSHIPLGSSVRRKLIPITRSLLLEVLRSDSKEDRRPDMSCREMAGSFRAGRSSFQVLSSTTALRSFALMAGLLHFRQDAVEVVGLRRLHRREFLVRQELLFPEQLADRQDVPVVEIGGAWRAERTGIAQQRLRVGANRLLERITLDVGDLGPVEGLVAPNNPPVPVSGTIV